ncbi:MAG: hypothetical protein L6R38_003225, partial [Xanthoria sp. 2 TBL-2021]
MDLIEGIGQRYLMGKANAAPQQLENLAKKQFKGDAATVPAKAATAAPNVGNNKEIEELRKQLAEVKAAQNKSAGPAKAESAAPNLGQNKEFKELRKQLDEVKAVQNKPAGGQSERRKSIESAVSRGRSRKSRERNESPFGKRIQSAGIPHHHAGPEKPKTKAPASGNARDIPTGKRPSSANALTAASARPVHQIAHGERHVPRSGPNYHSTPTGQGGDSHGKAQAPVVMSRIQERNIIDSTCLDSVSERPRTATDLFVVEVTEEEPRKQRRGRTNVVEVIEKK